MGLICVALSLQGCPQTTGADGDGAAGPEPVVRSGLGSSSVRLEPLLRRAYDRRRAGVGLATVAVFIQSSDVATTGRLVHRLGGQVRTIAGDVLTADVPAGQLQTLAHSRSVLHLEASRRLRPALDLVLPTIRADQVHQDALAMGVAYRGRGVVVGVVDQFIDTTHAAFRHADGTTRLVALWDQDLDGTPPVGYDYGHVCDSEEIGAGECAHEVSGNHGTHVAGIAAGSALSAAPFSGVAPEADIVFVDAGRSEATEPAGPDASGLCDAVAWIFTVADALGSPAVVNISLVHGVGPHDGTSLASRCIDNLVGPGRLIVASAGNGGQSLPAWGFDEDAALHASAVASDEPLQLHFAGSSLLTVELWFDAPVELEVRVGIVDEDDVHWTERASMTAEVGPVSLATSGGVAGPIIAGSIVTPSGAQAIQIAIEDENLDSVEPTSRWVLEIVGNGHFDAFSDARQGSFFVNNDPRVQVDSYMSIGIPAVANNVLAVGSYVLRNSWVIDGDEHHQDDPLSGRETVIGQLSHFSSKGPSRRPDWTGLLPDIAAPGEFVVSAMAASAQALPDKTLKPAPDGYHLLAGTSMSAPVVAGVVALMLERDPELTVTQVHDVLERTAVRPADPGASWQHGWGRGKIDALTAVFPERAQPPLVPGGGCLCTVVGTGRGMPPTILPLTALLGLGLLRRRRGGTPGRR